MASTFAQIGGARIGFINATWPLARLSADRDAIALRCLFKFTFPRRRITRLSRYRGFVSTGLQIEHTVPRYPGFIRPPAAKSRFPVLVATSPSIAHRIACTLCPLTMKKTSLLSSW